MTGEDLNKTGERISNLARLLNIREGATRKHDGLPPRIMKDAVQSGVGEGSVTTQEDLDLMLDAYYEARGWSDQGVPYKEKLDELGLSSYAHILEGRGYYAE
jgi:aldehyde:ferredoxin oxidoreductase